jgi:hypothetical protein
MGIEIAPLLGRYAWTCGTRRCLEYRVDCGSVGGLRSAWRTLELASRRHRKCLPTPLLIYSTTFLDKRKCPETTATTARHAMDGSKSGKIGLREIVS